MLDTQNGFGAGGTTRYRGLEKTKFRDLAKSTMSPATDIPRERTGIETKITSARCHLFQDFYLGRNTVQGVFESTTWAVSELANQLCCFQAWSSIVYTLIPNVKTLEHNLNNFTAICEADEVVLFERATFLVIAHSTRREFQDIHRFEKISNIIKQFKLSCRCVLYDSLDETATQPRPFHSKWQSQFHAMEVRNSQFAAFIDVLTPSTYVLVVMSDPTIRELAR